jgi:hypothetical protein
MVDRVTARTAPVNRHCEAPRSGDEAIQSNAHGPWIASALRASQ